MGFFAHSSNVVSFGRPRASGDPFAQRHMYSGFYPPEWGVSLSAAGIPVTPEIALTLAPIYSGVTRIGGDFMRMPVQIFKQREDGGKERVRGGPTSGPMGALSYRLRWRPNVAQTAAEFFACLAAQYVLRNRLYAEIRADESGPFGQLLPRHPDRVVEQRLPSGRLRFKILEPQGEPRFVTQDEMICAHDTSSGGFDALTRTQYGSQAVGTAIAAEHAAGRFFKSGMTAAVVATHPGRLEESDKAGLHADITRFAAGKENTFGVMLIEEDIKIAALGIDPQKAQMMDARNFGVREAARLLKMPPELLFADNTGTQTGRSWEEVRIEYHTACVGPIVVALEQALHYAVILDKDTFIIELLMDALYRGDLKTRAEYYQAALEGPWMWPSEIRVKEGQNPDPELDAIAAKRYRPGEPKGAREERGSDDRRRGRAMASRETYQFHMLLRENAVRVLRRERAAVEKLARKHASDVEGWQAALKEFFTEQARFVADTMRIGAREARDYCAQHGLELVANGLPVYDEQWERREADELVGLAIEDGAAAAA